MKSELQLQWSGGRRGWRTGKAEEGRAARRTRTSWETGEEAVPTPSTGRAPAVLLSRELLFWPCPSQGQGAQGAQGARQLLLQEASVTKPTQMGPLCPHLTLDITAPWHLSLY